MAKTNKDLELRIVAKNLASKTLKAVISDLKKFASSTSTSFGGLKTAFTGVTNGITKVSSGLRYIGTTSKNVFSGMVSGVGSAFDAIFSLKTLIMGLFAGILAKGVMAFTNLNAEFEKMKVTIDILSKGQGEVWFNKLNQFALDMPVSMQEVFKSFTTLQAYGLKPSIKLMENLLDVASVMPESGRAMEGIARAIGQIQSKNRLEGQEMRQLAEWGVPVYEAIAKVQKKMADDMGKTIADIPYTAIDSATAIKAILGAMEERFGGAAKRISHIWSGLTIRLTNYVKEFFRQIGEGGGMQPLKDQLESIVNYVEKSFKSGEMQKATSFIGSSFAIIFEDLFKHFKTGKMDITGWEDTFISALKKIIYTTTIFINTLSGLKLIFLVLKMIWIGVALNINVQLYAIIWAIDKVVEGFKLLVDVLPSSLPGVSSLQKAFSSFASTTSSMQEAQGENITLLGQLAYTTGEDIAKTADTMANRWGLANDMVLKLDANLQKFKTTQAIAPIVPAADESPGFKETPLKPQILTEEEVTAHKKAMKAFREENTKWMLENGSLWTQLGLSLDLYIKDLEKDKLKHASALFKNFFNSIENGFQSAFTNMINGSMNLAEGLQSVMTSILSSFTDLISQMIFNWVKGKALMLANELFFQKTMTAVTAEGETERLAIEGASAIKSVAIAIGSGIKKIMIYAYEAAAAAFKALAGIPIIGPLLAIGAGAAAFGTVIGFAKKVASFEKGTGLQGVKETGPAILHSGEIVLNKKESDIFRSMQAGEVAKPSETNVNLSFNISAMDGESVESIVRKKVIPLLRDNIRDFGKMRTAVREAT